MVLGLDPFPEKSLVKHQGVKLERCWEGFLCMTSGVKSGSVSVRSC